MQSDFPVLRGRSTGYARRMPAPDLQSILDTIAADMAAETQRGTVANYIPALARVDPAQFGIAVVTADGTLHCAGDAATPFSITSSRCAAGITTMPSRSPWTQSPGRIRQSPSMIG